MHTMTMVASLFLAALTSTAYGSDCNANGVDDLTDISSGSSADCNLNGIPDECETVNWSVSQAFDQGNTDDFTLNLNAQALSNAIRLTPAVNDLHGSIATNDASPLLAHNIRVQFDFKIGAGSGADIIWLYVSDANCQPANSIQPPPGCEYIYLELDTYENWPWEIPANGNHLDIRYGSAPTTINTQLATYTPTFNLRDYQWHHVDMTVLDGRATVILTPNGGAPETAFSDIALPGYTPHNWRVTLHGATGGLNDEHWVDNIIVEPAIPQQLDSNGNGIPDSCENPWIYCTAKVNSAGCTPSIGSSGQPSLAAPADDFHILASTVLNAKYGTMIWGGAAGTHPFYGGTLCITPPIVRTPGQSAGGNPPPTVDCSGHYSYHFTQAYMQQHLLSAGQSIYAQYWSRDPGFRAPNSIGLTDALRATLLP